MDTESYCVPECRTLEMDPTAVLCVSKNIGAETEEFEVIIPLD